MTYVRFASGPIYEKEDVSAFLTPNPYLIASSFFTESYKIYLSSTMYYDVGRSHRTYMCGVMC